MLSLPRPLSPPLHRITMSGSVALEYGFPSTHSTNAVSVAVYAVLMLADADYSPKTKLLLEGLSYFYAFSIIIGRLYCGMHGFVDVIVGSAMGAAIAVLEFYYGPPVHAYMRASTWVAPLIATLVVVVLVRVHPEPADDCPCFDDSVAFAGVVIGLEIGTWHVAAAPRFDLGALGAPLFAARVAGGVLVIFAWREAMKPALLTALPHLFRAIETRGLNLPRRFFVQASQYEGIPGVLRLRTDNVIPGVSDFPAIARSLKRATTRGRSVSIGPQSAADAYETLAYRERRRRESISSQTSVKSKGSLYDLREGAAAEGAAKAPTANDVDGKVSVASGIQKSPLAHYEEMMGQGTVVESFPPAVDGRDGAEPSEPDLFVGRQDELGEKEMFEKIVKPRVRYDVEVVTKLIVYAGESGSPMDGRRSWLTSGRYCIPGDGPHSHHVGVCWVGS
jgi:dihydrosphingosine 1-phosphate phosphatase